MSPALLDVPVPDGFDHLQADAVTLAAALCTSPFVPYPLLRRMRRAVLPAGSLGAEAALCSSDLVECTGAVGFTWESEANNAIRDHVRAADVDLTDVRRVLDAQLDLLPPLLQIEEAVSWAYITSEDFATEANDRYLDVARVAVFERRLRALAWASGAMTRVPPATLRTAGAWALAQLCASVGLPHPELSLPEPGIDEALREIFEAAHWLVPDRLVGYHRDGVVLDLGAPGRSRRVALRVPDTAPVVVWVTTPALGDAPVQVTDVLVGGTTLPVGTGAVTIRSLDGQVTELPPMSGGRSPELSEVDHILDRLDGAREAKEPMLADIVRLSQNRTSYIARLQSEPLLSVLLPGNYARFAPQDTVSQGSTLVGPIRVRVEQVDRARQRVTVRRVSGQWSSGGLVEGRRIRAELIAKSAGALFFWLNEAAGVPQPEFEPLIGRVPRRDLPDGPGWTRLPRQFRRSGRSHPLRLGEHVDVEVVRIQRGHRRVELRLVPLRSPSDEQQPGIEAVQPGARYRAVVTGKDYFGVFVALDDGKADGPGGDFTVPGLIANAELSWLAKWTYRGDARDYPLEVGDVVAVIVLAVDRTAGRVDVSLCRVTADPGHEVFAHLRIGQRVTAMAVARRGDTWHANVEPYIVRATVSVSALEPLSPKPGFLFEATVARLNRSTRRVGLTGPTALGDANSGGFEVTAP